MLKIVLKKLSTFEKAHTRTRETVKMMSKVFLAMYLNTTFVTFLVGLSIPGWVCGNDDASDTCLSDIFAGQYYDFTRGWFKVVGFAITTTLLLNIISDPLFKLFKKWLNWLKRTCCAWRCVSARDLNNLYTGP